MHVAISRAVQRNLASGFDDSFRRHLAVEQRRAVLDTIARELTADTTLGDIVDAAQNLGWGDSLGELRLADLAGALLGEAPAAPATAPADHDADADDEQDAADDEAEDTEDEEDDADDDADDDDAVAVAPPPRRGRKPAARPEPAAAPRKPSSLDRALDRIDKALAARGRKAKAEPRTAAKTKPAPTPPPAPAPTKTAAKKAAAPAPAPVAKKAAAKKTPAKKAAVRLADDDTDAMSLDQAAKMLVPMVRKLREATMQDLEEQTGMGRRKLRFHIGQLVKHGRLKRHGMGRGTCYTVK